MDDFRNLWQNQEVEPMKISIEELRAKTAKFRQTIYRRNLREEAGCLFALLAFGTMAARTSATIPRISFALIAAGAFYVAWHIQIWGAARELPQSMGLANCLAFQRRELKRQRDLLWNVWKWYLAPFAPGIGLLVGWGIAVTPQGKVWLPAPFGIVSVAGFCAIFWLNRRAARRLDAEIAELDRELSRT